MKKIFHLLHECKVMAVGTSSDTPYIAAYYVTPDNAYKVSLIDISKGVILKTYEVSNKHVPAIDVQLLNDQSIVLLGDEITVFNPRKPNGFSSYLGKERGNSSVIDRVAFVGCDYDGENVWRYSNTSTYGKNGSVSTVQRYRNVSQAVLTGSVSLPLFITFKTNVIAMYDSGNRLAVFPSSELLGVVYTFIMDKSLLILKKFVIDSKPICSVTSCLNEGVTVLFMDGELVKYTLDFKKIKSFRLPSPHYSAFISAVDRWVLLGETFGGGGGQLQLIDIQKKSIVATVRPELQWVTTVLLKKIEFISIVAGAGGLIAYQPY